LFFYFCEYVHVYFCMYLILLLVLGGIDTGSLGALWPYYAEAYYTWPVLA
jgi:hypothetical protein